MNIVSRYLVFPLAVVAAPALSLAQESTSESRLENRVIEEVLVTSSRLRDELVQEVPLAVTAISSEEIEKLNMVDVTGLASLAPNLTVTQMGPSAGAAAISIRGFVTAASDISIEPGVAVYVDGNLPGD